MADGEKPTSIWKKELSFWRKPDDEPVEAPAESGSTRSGRRRFPSARRTRSTSLHRCLADAGARRSTPRSRRSRFRPSRRRSSPRPSRRPHPRVEHDWLTQPLEEVSEPPAEVVSPVALVPEVVEPVVLPIAAVPAPEPENYAEPELDAGSTLSSTSRPPCCPSCSRRPPGPSRSPRSPSSSSSPSSRPRPSRPPRSPSTRRSSS